MTVHEKTAFGVKICTSSHPAIRRLKRSSEKASIHGNKFWKSSYLLMDYLTEYPIDAGANVLELGCGYGIGGIFCAKTYGANVTSLDADPAVFPFLELHAELNEVELDVLACRFEDMTENDLAEYDVIIGADICFWDSMTEALFKLVRRAKRSGDPRVIIADPGRDPFRVMADKACEKLDAEYDNWHVNHPHNASGLILEV